MSARNEWKRLYQLLEIMVQHPVGQERRQGPIKKFPINDGVSRFWFFRFVNVSDPPGTLLQGHSFLSVADKFSKEPGE
jgi:hypothetical protein